MRKQILVVLFGLLAAGAAAQKPSVRGTTQIRLTDPIEAGRRGFPLELTVQCLNDASGKPGEFALVKAEGTGAVSCAYQILDVQTQTMTSSYVPSPRAFVHLAFLADTTPGGTSTYEVVSGAQSMADPTPALKVTGTGVGRTVDTGRVVFELHPESGQLVTFTPSMVNRDRPYFIQDRQKGTMLAIHWNPDLWAPPPSWGHTSDWNQGRPFDSTRDAADNPPTSPNRQERPYFYSERQGPLAYRLTRWGRIPYIAGRADASVTYTFFAGAPYMLIQSFVECREAMPLNALRSSEIVFSRGQFDTALWIDRAGQVRTTACYDYKDPEHYFGTFQRLPADTPCLGFANERQGYGLALILLSACNVGKFSGYTADEQSQFYFLDTDMHGKGSPANFVYFCRPLVYRDGYGPNFAGAGTVYAENAALVVFALRKSAHNVAARYGELKEWVTLLKNPPRVVAD